MSALTEAFDHAWRQIERSPIMEDPFAHIVVGQLFPESFYTELLGNFPDRSRFQKVTYPGTGHGRRTPHYHDYGLACMDVTGIPVFAELAQFLSSERFARSMLDKFSRPLSNGVIPIPDEKHVHFEDATDYSSRFNLHIDIPGYELPPHADSPKKIVTYQLFLNEQSLPAEFGTLLCRPRDGRPTAQRAAGVKLIGALIDFTATLGGLRAGRLYSRLERCRAGLQLGVGANHGWMPWSKFDVVKTVTPDPNSLMAFAPSEGTYHAVRLPEPDGTATHQRRVLRGFIRAGANASNWISPIPD